MAQRTRLDSFQQRHGWLGFPIAVLYKYADDQGGYLAALLTYYAFLSLFPLLLVAATVLGFVLHNNPALQQHILSSALSQFPIVGHQLQANVHNFQGSGLALTIGILGLLYGGLGVAQAGQNVMNTVWAVPRNERPNPFKSRLRSLGLLGVFGVGVLGTTGLSGLTTGAHAFVNSLHLGTGARLVTLVLSLVLNIGLFIAAFRVLTDRAVSIRDIALGALIAAVAWQALQTVGTYYLAHELKNAGELYGTFGLVLGLIAWIHLESLTVVLCAEINAVLRHRLWPRALFTPFTDNVELTPADESIYTAAAEAQRTKGFETINVDFDGESEAGSREEG
jgi:membrane protein